MHEMSIAQSIVEIVEEAITNEPGARVDKVVVRIGRMVAVVPDSLLFCYDAITEGTALAGSALEIDEIPAEVRCRVCGKTTRVEDFVFRCRHCGGSELTTISGNEMSVSHIEVTQ